MAESADPKTLIEQLQQENAQLKQQLAVMQQTPMAFLHEFDKQAGLHEVLSDLPYYMCVLDESLHFLYVNRTYGGISIGEALEQKLYSVFPHFTHHIIDDAFARAKSLNKTIDFAVEAYNAYELRCRVQPIMNGKLWLFIVHDVSRENTNEKHLSKIQQRYVALNDNFPMAIIECDVHGNILQWSNGATKIFGYTKSEMLNEPLHKLSPRKKWAEKITETFNNAKAGKNNLQLQIAAHHKNGRKIHCRWHVNVIFEADEKISSFFIIGDDLTKVIETRNNLRKAKEQAESLADAKSNFIAAVSHELRTPMHGILNAAELLGSQLKKPSNKELVSLICDSGSALLHVIDDVLNYSKLEADKMQLNTQWVDLHHITENVCSLMQGTVQEKQNRIRLDSSAQDLLFYCDGGRIRQVLYNLVGNAVKFTHQGFIDVVLSYQCNDDDTATIHIQVKDTGIGIAKDKLDNIFESFFQADETINSRFGGSGLGLSISKKIAVLMGGNIKVESEEGVGSCFTLSLAAPYQHAQSKAPKKQGKRSYNKSILVVDDNAINISISIRLLERLGCSVDVATNGLEACEKAAKHSYDVIFMDIQMPVMDGYEAAKKIKAEVSESLPIVAMSANKLTQKQSEVMTSFLTKPFNQEQLVGLLDDLFLQGEDT